MMIHTGAYHLTTYYIQRGVEIDYPVPPVVVSLSFRDSLSQRENRLSALECLYLRFLVYSKN